MRSNPEWARALAESFREAGALADFLGWPLPDGVETRYPLLVPRRLAALIRAQGPDGALARQFLPNGSETSLPGGLIDPIGDTAHAPTSQLIHRYGDRALLLPTTKCPVNCRYCFRKNELGAEGPFAPERDATFAYLADHPEIEEVILTGGDPLVLSDEKIGQWLEALAGIPHVRWVRFHTRAPVVLPERLDAGLTATLGEFAARFEKILMVLHSNHVSEWDQESRAAVRAFRGPAIEWLSQSVLLKGVNDEPAALAALFRQFSTDGIRPYYLHHPDRVLGAMHFYLPLEEGRRLYGALRDLLPGWAIPQYMLDVPGGHGKVPAFNPEAHAYSGRLLDRKGAQVDAPEQSTHP